MERTREYQICRVDVKRTRALDAQVPDSGKREFEAKTMRMRAERSLNSVPSFGPQAELRARRRCEAQ